MTNNYDFNKLFFYQIYNNELESIPEFNGFEDNLRKFKIYEFDKKDEKATVIAILKVNYHRFIINLLRFIA